MKASDVHAASELLRIVAELEFVVDGPRGYLMLSLTEEPNGDGEQFEIVCLVPPRGSQTDDWLDKTVDKHLRNLMAEILRHADEILGVTLIDEPVE